MIEQYTLLSPAQCLINHLKDYFCSQNSYDFSSELIILPTQRLATKLISLLALELDAIIPPQIETFESFARDAVAVSCQTLSDSAIELLILENLKTHKYHFLRPGHQRELRLIYGEMIEQEIFPEAFASGRNYLMATVYHSDKHINTLSARLSEIESCLASIHEYLGSQNLCCRQAEVIEVSQKKLDNLDSDIRSYKRIIVAGQTSLSPSWQKLLQKLVEFSQVYLVLSDLRDLPNTPLAGLIEKLQLPRDSTWISTKKDFKQQDTTTFKVASPLHEVSLAIKIADKYKKAGVPASSIGIILAQEQVYAPIFQTYANKFFMQDNLAMTRPLAMSKIGMWLGKFLDHICDRESLTIFFDWLTDPITARYLERNYELHPYDLTEHAVLNKSESVSHLLRKESSQNKDQNWTEALAELTGLVGEERRHLTEWLDFLKATFVRFALENAFEDQYADSQKTSIDQFLTDMTALSGLQKDLYSIKEFSDIVREQLLAKDLRVIGEPLAGLQVLGLSESRYYPFEVIILLGCNEGYFPKALPKDELIDDHLKQQMGFPGWHRLEAMEDQTFRLFAERTPKLFLVRSTQVAGRETIASRFLESFNSQKNTHHSNVANDLNLFCSDDISKLENIGLTDGLRSPVRESYWQKISASKLEKLIRCPLRFYLSRHKIEPFHYIESDDPRELGNWQHKVLESLFELEPPFFHSDDQAKSWLVANLGQLTLKHGPLDVTRKAVYFHLILFSWPAFADHLVTIFSGRWHFFKQSHQELDLRCKPSESECSLLKIRDQPRQTIGKVDSVILLDDLTIVTDYKSSKIPDKNLSTRGIIPQLMFYANVLKSQKKFNDKIIVGYWNIKGGRWECHGISEKARAQAIAMGLATKKSPDLDEAVTTHLQLWRWREEDILGKNQYYADPSFEEEYCKYCDYTEVCRLNDPSRREKVLTNNHLNQHLEKG